MVKQAFLDAVEWCKANPKLAGGIALLLFVFALGVWVGHR